ncbi:MAG: hypothetical protein ABIK86_06875, partial [candidate division WOR-3 bacterium]
MVVVWCVLVCAFAPVQVFQTEQTLAKGAAWSRDLILAPGDTLRVNASFVRQTGSSCGPFGFLGDFALRRGDNVGRVMLSE